MAAPTPPVSIDVIRARLDALYSTWLLQPRPAPPPAQPAPTMSAPTAPTSTDQAAAADDA
jgi:hypothetical protein